MIITTNYHVQTIETIRYQPFRSTMSKIYTESKIFCPCSEQQTQTRNGIDTSSLPMTIIHPGTNHDVGDLFFCPTCQGHKCMLCCEVNVESKYCSNCMTDFTNTNETMCIKNCFTCPICDAGLAISAVDSRSEDSDGKVFRFKCFYCEYQYNTATILKPKSLLSIIKSEKKQKDNGYSSLFAKFHENYVNKQNLMRLETNQDRRRKNVPRMSGDVLQKFKDLELSNLADSMKDSLDEILLLASKINQNGSVTIDENQDLEYVSRVSSIQNLNSFTTLERQAMYSHFNSTLNNGSLMEVQNKISNPQAPNQLPIPKKLVTKKSYRCLTCHQVLLMPHKEPCVIKLVTKWNAIDFIPTLRISNLIDKEYPKMLQSGKLYNLLLSIINPLPREIDMVITTMPQVPLELLSNSYVNVHVALSVSNIRVGGIKYKKDLNSIVKSIPTPFLTNNTKLSRTELIMRLGKLNSTYNSSDDSLEISDINVERGDNWCLIPINIHIETLGLQQSLVSIKIPFYITVKSQVPESMQTLNLANLHLRYGYWTIINFGSFLIES